MGKVTWFCLVANHVHSALCIPHFTFRVTHSAFPHFTDTPKLLLLRLLNFTQSLLLWLVHGNPCATEVSNQAQELFATTWEGSGEGLIIIIITNYFLGSGLVSPPRGRGLGGGSPPPQNKKNYNSNYNNILFLAFRFSFALLASNQATSITIQVPVIN